MAFGKKKNKSNPYSNPDNFDENGNFIGDTGNDSWDSTDATSGSFNSSGSSGYSYSSDSGYYEDYAGKSTAETTRQYYRRLRWYERTSTLLFLLFVLLLVAAGLVGILIFQLHQTESNSTAAETTTDWSAAQSQATAAPEPSISVPTPTPVSVPTMSAVSATGNWKPGDTVYNEQDFIDAAAYARSNGWDSLDVTLEAQFYQSANQHRLAALAGMEKYSAAYGDWSHEFIFENIVWSGLPVYACSSEDEIASAVHTAAEQGTADYTLVLTPDLYASMTANDWAGFYQVTAKGGLYAFDQLSYAEESAYITVHAAQTAASIQYLTTLGQLREYAEGLAANEASVLPLFCSQEIYAQVMAAENSIGLSYLSDLASECGILSLSYTNNDVTNVIVIYAQQYYAGFRVVHAWQRGDTSGLTDREKQTYDAALLMANELRTGDTFTTAIAIHDRLCETIEYSADADEGSEDDCATGALLNHLANCDGYADAFYLVGTMAGLDVRCLHGDTYEKITEGTPENATHVWNLLLLNGSWTHLDVTWDDRDDELEYEHIWFAVGDDRMQRTHYWNADTTVPTASATDLSRRPQGEYTVTSDEELAVAMQDAVNQGYPQVTVFFENGMSLNTDRVVELLRRAGCSRNLSYIPYDRMNCVTIVGIS